MNDSFIAALLVIMVNYMIFMEMYPLLNNLIDFCTGKQAKYVVKLKVSWVGIIFLQLVVTFVCSHKVNYVPIFPSSKVTYMLKKCPSKIYCRLHLIGLKHTGP